MLVPAEPQDQSEAFPQSCTSCSVREEELVVASSLSPRPDRRTEEFKTLLTEHSRRIEELERLLDEQRKAQRERPALAIASSPDPQDRRARRCDENSLGGFTPQFIPGGPPHARHRNDLAAETTKRQEDVSRVPNKAVGSSSAPPAASGLIHSSASASKVFAAGADVSFQQYDMKLFDQDQLKAIYDKPYKRARQQAALFGGGFLGILSMPFGPIGMAAGGMFGGLTGAGIGYLIDRRTDNSRFADSEKEKKRLKSLVRWATSRSHDEQDIITLLEVVTLEFKPIADIAAGSKNARKLLKQLDRWISQKNVTRQLWVYMDRLLSQWRDLNRGDFLRSMRVFQTLSTMYKYTQRVLDDHEHQFMQRMERLLEHESVKSVMYHAHLNPTMEEKQVMECLVFADALKGSGWRNRSRSAQDLKDPPSRVSRSPSNHSGSPGAKDLENQELSDDSEDDLVVYTGSASPGGGLRLAPAKQVSPGDTPMKSRQVLKKPFFKSWEDFMDFDLNVKHKMPITLSEFELLLQKEVESNKGWDVCVDRKDIKVSKASFGSFGFTLRAWATIPNADMQVAFYLFYDFNERVKWDKIFNYMCLVGDANAGSEILYSLMKVPTITPRDFLQYRRVRIMDDGTILIVLRSADHPDMPLQHANIRAESYISGYVLRQIYEDGVPVLKIFLMSCSDVKGFIPKWIINWMAPKKPAEWLDALKKAVFDYQEANPNTKEKMQAYVDSFAKPNPFDYEPEGPTSPPTPEQATVIPAVQRQTSEEGSTSESSPRKLAKL